MGTEAYGDDTRKDGEKQRGRLYYNHPFSLTAEEGVATVRVHKR
jgi:hypothetical protein